MTGQERAASPVAAITLDVEDWWHLDYLGGKFSAGRRSLLDGLETFTALMAEADVRATLFVLGELAAGLGPRLRAAAKEGHAIACHGWGHGRPMLMSPESFREDLRKAKAEIEDIVGGPVRGYRAPCFSLDRPRLEIVRELGFEYDSSKIAVVGHPLYGSLDLSGFSAVEPGVYEDRGFVEFEATTAKRAGQAIPISGGGYLRMFPWPLTRRLISGHIKGGRFYLLYIHPFELSASRPPVSPREAGTAAWTRFSLGRRKTAGKLRRLLALLKSEGYRLESLPALREVILKKYAANHE
jgi:polysaccharide deacetylase family protein (PEP-CTERM system associated)